MRLFIAPGAREAILEGRSTDLAEFPQGLDTKDSVVNQIAVVLRMLYLHDFRELQNDLNALIVLGQDYTANPRTNSALGKVGR
jgi:RLL motif-containing protein 1